MTHAAEAALRRLLDVMAALRDPASGCPWDQVQSFDTIAPYTIEEAYEVADAIARADFAALPDELGDLLFQVVYHARMAEEAGKFSFADVAAAIADKMVRRHPHVFGDAAARDAAAQTAAWEEQKLAERTARAETGTLAGIPLGLPALTRAEKLARRAARVGFDWPDTAAVLEKLEEEIAELRAELPAADPVRLADEVGDLLFVVVNLARKLQIDPEACLRAANAKFARRFGAVEAALAATGRTPAEATLAEMEAAWQAVKQAERAPRGPSPPPAADIAPHMTRFVTMLDRWFRQFGVADGLPALLRAAVLATPRHRFVHRFRIEDGPLHDLDAEPRRHLATVYSDRILRHVDATGVALASTNSQPSYVLWLLHLLGLASGQAVLEIGSGSGWLVAVMARLVGARGHVTGIEIIAELAEQSRRDLAALGLANVTILAQDGTRGDAAGAPYDRVVITAATWDVPAALFDQVAEGGRLLVPVALRGGDGCQVTILRRAGERFVTERAVGGAFVPLVGPGQQDPAAGVRLAALPFWSAIGAALPSRAPMSLAMAAQGQSWGLGGVAAFRAFLGRTEPGFAVFDDGEPSPQAAGQPFGIIDAAAHSVAVWTGGEVLTYGAPAAAERLAGAYARWAELGLPGIAAFDLEVVRAGAAAAEAGGRSWVETRGDSALVWRLKPGAGALPMPAGRA